MITRKAYLIILILLVVNFSISQARQTNYLSSNGGNQLVDAAGNEVRLTGVNWFGFETGTNFPHGIWNRDMRSMLIQIKSLGFNSLRVPWSNEMLQPGTTISINSYGTDPVTGISPMNELEGNVSTPLELMDLFMEHCRELNLKVVLDNHSRAADAYLTESLWYTNTVSESKWIEDWVFLADRYKDNDAFIGADINNEPHETASWGNSNPATDWNKAAERCGNAILAANPNLLIIVEGVENAGGTTNWWGGNLSAAGDYPVVLSNPNKLVYSMHEYGPEVFLQTWFEEPNFPNNMAALWDTKFDYLYQQNVAPMFAGEFGIKEREFAGGKAEVWFDTWMAYMGNRYSWTFWSWNPNSGDTGGILNDDWTTIVDWKVEKLTPYMAPEIPNGSTGSGPINSRPIAVLAATPTTGQSPLQISYDASASSDADGDNLTYSWNFGDGSISSLASGTHTYTEAGTYSLSLTVNDGQINSVTVTQTINVFTSGVNTAPVANVTLTPVSGTAPLSITFDGSGSSDPDGDAITYDWNFDDGTVSIQKNGTHTFTSPGTYTVNLVVNDGTVNSTPATVDVIVSPSGNTGSCSFGTPLQTALPSIVNNTYNNVHILGSGGPNLNNVNNFTINWDLTNNGLWQLSMNTSNGSPDWWVNLLSVSNQNFNQIEPEISFTGSGFAGLDGSYYATSVGNDFALVSKTGTFTIYFSNSTTPPSCTLNRLSIAQQNNELPNTFSLFPNPSSNQFTLQGNEVDQIQSIRVIDQSGKLILNPNVKNIRQNNQITFGQKLSKGIYFVMVMTNNYSHTYKVIKTK